MASFSNDTKSEIIGLDIKGKKCCLFSFLYGFLFCSYSENNSSYIKSHSFKTKSVFSAFVDFM